MESPVEDSFGVDLLSAMDSSSLVVSLLLLDELFSAELDLFSEDFEPELLLEPLFPSSSESFLSEGLESLFWGFEEFEPELLLSE